MSGIRTIDTAAFKRHLLVNMELHGTYQLQLIVNETSAQWMTDDDMGATWWDEIHTDAGKAVSAVRKLLGADPHKALSARMIF